MVSFEAGQRLRTTVRALALTVLAAPGSAPAQPTHDVPADDALRPIVESIRAAREQDGPHSPDLIDPLQSLVSLYQQSGDHGRAAAVIEQALQVIRANYGLRSLDQAPLIRQWIRSEEARGNHAAAWRLEQSLLNLAQNHPEDLRTVPVLRELGDRRMDLLGRYLAGEFPPEIELGCFYGEHSGSCTAGSRRTVIEGILADAWSRYRGAIGVLLRNRLYSSDELRELEMELVRAIHAHGGDPAEGNASLHRLLFYEAASSAPVATLVERLVQIADWHLLYTTGTAAYDATLAIYEHARDLLLELRGAEASIERLFHPALPVSLPAFEPNVLASEETERTTGHIDVAFEITKYGRSRKVEVLESTATKSAERALTRTIMRSRFRPRLTDGRFAETSRAVLRYYVAE